MSYRKRHRWFRRMVIGLAFSLAMFAGRTSVAAAKVDEGVGSTRYVSAGGWSGEVDPESGVPVSAGIPAGDEQLIDPSAIQVIPYLSHGILSEADAQAAAAQASQDPYLTDVFVRPGEAQAGPDGSNPEQWTVVPYLSHGLLGESAKTLPLNRVERALQDPQVIPYLSHGILTESDAQLVAAQATPDPNLARLDDRQVGVDGDQVAIANAVESQRFAPGSTDFPTSPPVDTPQLVASSSGSTVEWNDAMTAGIAAFVLVLGLGLAFGHFKRPKLAGL
jgi:hypothetical protein